MKKKIITIVAILLLFTLGTSLIVLSGKVADQIGDVISGNVPTGGGGGSNDKPKDEDDSGDLDWSDQYQFIVLLTEYCEAIMTIYDSREILYTSFELYNEFNEKICEYRSPDFEPALRYHFDAELEIPRSYYVVGTVVTVDGETTERKSDFSLVTSTVKPTCFYCQEGYVNEISGRCNNPNCTNYGG